MCSSFMDRPQGRASQPRAAISHLAPLTIKAATVRCSQILPCERNLTARARALVMREPVLAEHVRLLPFEEVEAVLAGLRDELAQLARRQLAHFRGRMRP